jgi:hypothetical protein
VPRIEELASPADILVTDQGFPKKEGEVTMYVKFRYFNRFVCQIRSFTVVNICIVKKKRERGLIPL